MTNQRNYTLIALVLCLTMGCAQSSTNEAVEQAETPHPYGGWYCPDNLGGFPAIDVLDWESVPVVNGRMPTEQETQNGTSLIRIDVEKYPDAKPLEMQMPRLARFYCWQSGKSELVIVIQALNVSNDSIVGFRYLNGGNGSARLNKVTFLSESDVENLTSARFVNLHLKIEAASHEVWDVLTHDDFSQPLALIFDEDGTLPPDWNASSEVNFKYLDAGTITSDFAGELFGNLYVQIDSKSGENQFVTKFFLSGEDGTNKSELQIVCGPYGDDFEKLNSILTHWAQKVQELSEAL
jgi:hypothetical protein